MCASVHCVSIPFGKFTKLTLWLKSDWLQVILWLQKSEAMKQAFDTVAFTLAFECFNINRKVKLLCIKRFKFLKSLKHILKSALAKALKWDIM